MSIVVDGLDRVLNNLSSFSDQTLRRVVMVAQMSQGKAVNHARSNHDENAHAIERFISHHGGAGLVGSIQAGAVEVRNDIVTAWLEARMAYASYVELGTSRARAYPFMLPAIIAESPNFKKNLAREISRIRL